MLEWRERRELNFKMNFSTYHIDIKSNSTNTLNMIPCLLFHTIQIPPFSNNFIFHYIRRLIVILPDKKKEAYPKSAPKKTAFALLMGRMNNLH